MSTENSLSERLQEWNQNGRLYLWGGVITVLVTWFLFALAGPIAIVLGYKLHAEEDRTVAGSVIGVLGGVGLLLWIVAVFGM